MKDIIQQSIDTKSALLEDRSTLRDIAALIDILIAAYRRNNKLLLCGNGGSAADAQHIAAELSGRFRKDRKALHAEALHVNTSFLTAVSNDYGFHAVFERGVEAFGNKGDVLVCLSTSGNSANIIKAAVKARDLQMTVIGMTGQSGGRLADLADLCIKVPSKDTARIQECHILIGHILCQYVEENLFP